MKRAWQGGTTAVAFEPLDFMVELAALVPRPRQNLLRYHGGMKNIDLDYASALTAIAIEAVAGAVSDKEV